MAGCSAGKFNTVVPPGLTPFFDELYKAGFMKRGGKLICTYFDENFFNLVQAEQVEGLYSCLDYYQELSAPFSKELLNRYKKLFPGSAQFTAGSACSGLYRGMKLWEAAPKWRKSGPVRPGRRREFFGTCPETVGALVAS